jgi:hypothetical protein
MSTSTLAHATWFTEARPDYDLAGVLRPATLAIGLAVVMVAIVWRRVARRLPQPELPFLRHLGRLGPWVPRLLAIHAGVSLLAHAARGEYFAPSLTLPPTWWGYTLMALEGVIGIWLITGIRVRPPALLLVAAGPLGMLGYGVLPILERLDLLGVAVFLALLPTDDRDRRGRVTVTVDVLRPALLSLRGLVGTALIAVAVTEKLIRPELTLAFLEQYPAFNVAQLVGLPLSHEGFVLLAAGVEILFGLLLVSGALPQVVALLAGVPFLLPVAFLGVPELLGHLPIYGVLLALLVYGSSRDTASACSWFPSTDQLTAPIGDDRAPAAGAPLPALLPTTFAASTATNEGEPT